MKKMLIIVAMVMVALVMVVGGFQIRADIKEQKEIEYANQLMEGTEYDTVVMYEDENGITHYEVYDLT